MAEGERRCQIYGAAVRPEDRFCWNCGAPLGRPLPPGQEAGRREPADGAGERPWISGGIILPGIYVPIGRQYRQQARLGWILALILLGILLLSLAVSAVLSWLAR